MAVTTSFVMLLFAYSCASFQIPEPSRTIQSILIIPILREEGVSRSQFGEFELCVKGQKERIVVHPEYKYEIVSTLKPGNYEIYKIQPLYRQHRGKKPKPLEVNIKFSLISGQITILSEAFIWKFTKYGMEYGVIECPSDAKKKIISELSNHKNFHLWILIL